MTKHTILFLAANPFGTDRLALDEEARAMQLVLEQSSARNQFELQTRWATRPLDLLHALTKLRPTVVHFSGHGRRDAARSSSDLRRNIVVDGTDRDGLYFHGPDGGPQLVSAAELQQAFGAAGASVKLVVLSTCDSDRQVEALVSHVDCVVGMTGALADDDARRFAIGLYGGLGERLSIANAFKRGCAAIRLDGSPGSAAPRLVVRAGVDAARLVLTDHAAALHDLLIADYAGWGRRHVFANKTLEQWNDKEAVPFLAVQDIYVEPEGVVVDERGKRPGEPLLALLDSLTAITSPPRLVIVTADFGSGKSLTARELARRWAAQRLAAQDAHLDVPLPIYVRCASDFPSDTVDLELTVRRAWKRHAEALGQSVAETDESFAWPSARQHVVCLLDGLDEVALTEPLARRLFESLRGKMTSRHRFVIFSRPGALPPYRDLERGATVVQVQPFRAHEVERWLARWNSLHPEHPPITAQELARRHGATIARTPILLFLIAFTWRRQGSHRAGSAAELYEQFFHQVASGKAHTDPDGHGPIARASEQLLGALETAGVLEVGATRVEAMLWLLGRVAWETHMLEQRHPPEPLTRRHVDTLLRTGEAAIGSEASDTIRIALVLTLQADLHGANHTLLFGHRSFREFLVGRHWASSLRRLVRGRHGADLGAADSLLGGRLLAPEDGSFDYLMQMINAPKAAARRTSPVGWSDDERAKLVRWAQATFDDERLEFGERAGPRRGADATLSGELRCELREAALAIGSLTKGSEGIRASNPLALRSMLARFWLTGDRTRVIACGADLRWANLRGVDLRGANLRGAQLGGADLIQADLIQADLYGAKLEGALLRRADLRGANLCSADLRGAFLDEANLRRVHLFEADLTGADLLQANLRGANLCSAKLGGANLSAANLSRAELWGAKLDDAVLCGADLREARLQGAQLQDADLRGVDLRDAVYGEATRWPRGFDPVAAGACLADARNMQQSLHGSRGTTDGRAEATEGRSDTTQLMSQVDIGR